VAALNAECLVDSLASCGGNIAAEGFYSRNGRKISRLGTNKPPPAPI
jgi:hypothetical protein